MIDEIICAYLSIQREVRSFKGSILWGGHAPLVQFQRKDLQLPSSQL